MAENSIKDTLETTSEYIGSQLRNKLDSKEEKFRVDELPTPSASIEGEIYQYMGDSTIDYQHSYFYECVALGTNPETYGWLVVNVQPSESGQTIQYDTMPTSSSENEDDIIQYIGETTANYTNGFFYKCVAQGTDPETYAWEAQPVQEGGSAGHTIEDSTGTDMTARANLQFVGANVSDDSVNNRTVVTVNTSGKADKVANATSGNLASLDNNGNLADSGVGASNVVTKSQTAGLLKNDGTVDTTTYVSDVSGKADKVTSVTSGNFAGLDANGNITDSGKKASDFVTDVSGKADKVSSPISGDLASLDSNGNIADSGIASNIFPSTATSSNKLATMADIGSGGDSRIATEITGIGIDLDTLNGNGTLAAPYIEYTTT